MYKQTKYVGILLLCPMWAHAVVSLPSDGLGIAALPPSATTLLPGNPFGTQDDSVQASSATVTITQNGETTVFRSEDDGGSSVGIGSFLPGLGLTAQLGLIGGPLISQRAIGVLSLGGLSSLGLGNLPIGLFPVAGRFTFGPGLRLP